MSKSRGFTLIELLITISIIAILSAIGMIAYSTVLKQGRDSKRQADLRTIQSALEQYHSDKGYYPADYKELSPATGRKYLTTIPDDPNKATFTPEGEEFAGKVYRVYAYQYKPSGSPPSSYVLCALFEVPPSSKPIECDMKCAATKDGWCNGGVSPP